MEEMTNQIKCTVTDEYRCCWCDNGLFSITTVVKDVANPFENRKGFDKVDVAIHSGGAFILVDGEVREHFTSIDEMIKCFPKMRMPTVD